uniref:PIN domain-containing protein n=1 Tax=Methanococcoides sp. AM1 TaxID=1201011 RepID=UPI001082B255
MKYLFDTNVLLKNPALLRDYHLDVVVSPTVLKELDYRKRFAEHQENAQLSIKHINQHHIKLLGISKCGDDCNNDARIINEVKRATSIGKITVVSDDEGLQVVARTEGVNCINLVSFQKEMM